MFLTISFYINKFCLPLVILSAREEFFEDKVPLLLPYWQIAIFLFSGIGRFFPLYFFLISAYQCIIILLKKQEKLAREFARFAVFCQFSSRMTMPLSSPTVLCSRTWILRSFYYLYLEENEKKNQTFFFMDDCRNPAWTNCSYLCFNGCLDYKVTLAFFLSPQDKQHGYASWWLVLATRHSQRMLSFLFILKNNCSGIFFFSLSFFWGWKWT